MGRYTLRFRNCRQNVNLLLDGWIGIERCTVGFTTLKSLESFIQQGNNAPLLQGFISIDMAFN